MIVIKVRNVNRYRCYTSTLPNHRRRWQWWAALVAAVIESCAHHAAHQFLSRPTDRPTNGSANGCRFERIDEIVWRQSPANLTWRHGERERENTCHQPRRQIRKKERKKGEHRKEDDTDRHRRILYCIHNKSQHLIISAQTEQHDKRWTRSPASRTGKSSPFPNEIASVTHQHAQNLLLPTFFHFSPYPCM